MGTFMGHVLPGSFFFSFAVWWCIRTFKTYYASVYGGGSHPTHHGGGRYRNAISQPIACCWGRVRPYQVEGVLVLFTTAVGILGEAITGVQPDGGFRMENAQHISMFFAFAVMGLASILEHHRLPMIMDGALSALLVVALIVEAVLFNFHVHGRDDLDKHIHYLLVYVVCGCIASVIAAQVFIHSVVAGLAKCFFFLLQGTWFFQVAFILYSPLPNASPWERDEHKVGESIMISTLYFSWHLIGISIGMAVVGALVYLCGGYSSAAAGGGGYEATRNPLLQNGVGNRKHHRPLSEETDSEVDEFSQV